MLRDIFLALYRDQGGPFNELVWHKWIIYWPARSIHGKIVFGNVWRRKGTQGWQYQARPETADEFWDRQH